MKLTGRHGAPLALMAGLTALLFSSACVPTGAIRGRGKAPGQNQARAQHVEVEVAATPSVVASESGEAERSPGVRIRQLLDEAEVARRRLFGDPGERVFSLETEKEADDGRKMIRVYRLVHWDGRERKILGVRSIYEQVLEMDPGNVQALLGLGNMALVEAVTHSTAKQSISWTLGTSKKLGDEERTRLQKKQDLIARRLVSSLKAARVKFQDVLRSSPSEPAAYLGLGMADALQGGYKAKARTMLDAVDDLGMADALQGGYKAAAKRFEMMERNNVVPRRKRSIFYVWYGFVLEASKARTDAIAKYERAAELLEPYAWGSWARARVETIHLFEK